jgi:hypothetical protein
MAPSLSARIGGVHGSRAEMGSGLPTTLGARREAETLLAERDYYPVSRDVLAELAGVAAQTRGGPQPRGTGSLAPADTGPTRSG